MLRFFSLTIYLIIKYLNKTFYFLTKRNFIQWLNFFIQNDLYRKMKILNKEVVFFVPNNLIEWRVRTLFDKEPETISWINSFKDKNIIFWDIGANIGLFSIYAALKFKNIKIFAFEPSTSNLRVLSRNISNNNLQKKIYINQIALTDKKSKYLEMKEMDFMEGISLCSFGENFNFEGKKFKKKNSYLIFGDNIDSLIKKNTVPIPNYIKIDVDGIEHLILKGAKNLFNNNKIKSVSIEINDNFKTQKKEVINFMTSKKFKIVHKKNNELFSKNEFSNTYNYLFERK